LGDVTDKNSLIKASKDVDHIFHLAGVVGYSKAMRPIMERVNIQGTQNVIEAQKINKLGRMMYFSSVVAIGSGFTPLDILTEESPYNIAHLKLGYFDTKYAAEQLIINAVKNNEIDATLVNPSTIYGPGDAKKASRKTQLKVSQGRFPFYPSGGVNIVAIDDVVKATYKCWTTAKSGERYILAGENILIKDLFNIIAEFSKVKSPSIYLPKPIIHLIGKVGDVLEAHGKKAPINSENAWTSSLYHWFDASKAKKELDFNPKSAREAIKSSVQWILENHT